MKFFDWRVGGVALFCMAGGFAEATPKVEVGAAVEVKFMAEKGKLYQVEVQKGEAWETVGMGVKGTGEVVKGFYPAGKYRVIVPEKQWVPVWADEFEGDELDASKWAREENNYGGGNNERQAYLTGKKYCYVKGGVLNISAFRDAHTTVDGKTQPYSSARIRSLHRGEWTFGRFEIRAKMPSGQGIWPAVWMLPTESRYGGWASDGEIDIIESRGSQVGVTTGALHFGGAWPRNVYVAHEYKFPGKNAAEDFHVYALEWTAKEIKWFVDGKLCKTREAKEWFSEVARENKAAPFDQPFHLIINLAVDGRFFEATKQRADLLPADAFPQTLQVDYVRVFQWAE